MMRTFLITLFSILLLSTFGQAQTFQKPSPGKSLVHFVRFQGAMAVLPFKYFDGETYLGEISGNNHFSYECEPGEHLFWVVAENAEFVRGELKANSTYVIEVRPYMRAVSAGVNLYPVNPENERLVKRISKYVDNNPSKEPQRKEDDRSDMIKFHMEKVNSGKAKVKELNADWVF